MPVLENHNQGSNTKAKESPFQGLEGITGKVQPTTNLVSFSKYVTHYLQPQYVNRLLGKRHWKPEMEGRVKFFTKS